MPAFNIKIVNEDFSASEERELPDAESARREALIGALAIGSEALYKGTEKLFGAEVTISEGGQKRLRFLVAMGATPLKTVDEA